MIEIYILINVCTNGDYMKMYKFIVWFANENYMPQPVKLVASNASTAIILAQAQRIKSGLDYTVFEVQKKEG